MIMGCSSSSVFSSLRLFLDGGIAPAVGLYDILSLLGDAIGCGFLNVLYRKSTNEPADLIYKI